MRTSLIKGFCFGLTSGIITTLGMIVGLYSFSSTKLVVLGGVLSIAIADSFSDALGMHVSEESDSNNSTQQIWLATITTFISKFLFSSTFIIPILLFPISTAVIISVIYGLILLSILSYFIALSQKNKPWLVIGEHLFIAILVILTTHYIGDWINQVFS